jgi:hypothetical protein
VSRQERKVEDLDGDLVRCRMQLTERRKDQDHQSEGTDLEPELNARWDTQPQQPPYVKEAHAPEFEAGPAKV